MSDDVMIPGAVIDAVRRVMMEDSFGVLSHSRYSRNIFIWERDESGISTVEISPTSFISYEDDKDKLRNLFAQGQRVPADFSSFVTPGNIVIYCETDNYIIEHIHFETYITIKQGENNYVYTYKWSDGLKDIRVGSFDEYATSDVQEKLFSIWVQ